MRIEKVHLVYFSPAGSTQKVVQKMAEEFSLPREEHDLTVSGRYSLPERFSGEELVILGVPVYSGRVPRTALERFAQLRGENTPAVLVVTYGNRHYDDALLELKTVLESKGFCPVGGAAVVTQHCIVPSIGKGRPSEEDIVALQEFCGQVQQKLEQASSVYGIPSLVVPGKRPYHKYADIPFQPHGGKNCTGCGLCAQECPVQAISRENPLQVDRERCITCMRCVTICPNGARKLYPWQEALAKLAIAKECKGQKECHWFL